MPSKQSSQTQMSFLDHDDIDQEEVIHLSNVNGKKIKIKSGSFQTMGLHLEVMNGIKRMGFNAPTPIQRQAIPVLLEGSDVVAMARTGSGKTAAFAIPLLHKLSTSKTIGQAQGVRAIVLSPTRELAQQTFKVIQQLGKSCNYKIIMLIGGQALHTQFELLANIPDIIVATPGRLVHHLLEVQFSLQHVEFCCFDEADRLFEMGFAQQLYEIIRRMNENRQTALFSATMPQALIEFSRAGLKNPVSVRLDNESKLSPDLHVSFFALKSNEKVASLTYVLKHVIPHSQQAIVFVSTRHHVDFLVELLNIDGIVTNGIYGVMDADSRSQNIDLFKTKKTRILVVTDLAARGIDIPLLDNVIHYDFPTQPKLYIHRSGRVARAGKSGNAFTFVSPDDYPYFIDLCLFFGWRLPFNTKKPTPVMIGGETNTSTIPGDDDDHDSKLTTVTDGAPEFGMIPTAILDFEIEHTNKMIALNDLERLIIGCNNAYEKYSKSKGAASTLSVKRWKEIRESGVRDIIPIHPWFLRQISDQTNNVHDTNSVSALIDAEQAKRELMHYNPSQTVFELMNRDMDMVKAKRIQHDKVIANTHGLQEVVGHKLARKYQEELSDKQLPLINAQTKNHTTTIRVKVKEEKQIITVADRRKRKALDDRYKAGKITDKEYACALAILPSSLRIPIVLDSTAQTLAKKEEKVFLEKEPKQLDQFTMDNNIALSRADLPPMMLLNRNATKRPLQPDNFSSDKPKTSSSSSTGKTANSAAKIAYLQSLISSVSSELNVENSEHLNKRKKRGQMTGEELRSQHFISLTPSGNKYEEAGLSIGRVDEMALELTAEDADGLRQQRKTRKWNERTKKFVTRDEGKNAFGKLLINESGQKVNKDYVPGQLYAQWRSKNKQYERDENDESVMTNKPPPMGDKRHKNGEGSRGRKFPSLGLKNADEIMKDRAIEKKNAMRAKNGSGGRFNNKGGNKGGRK